MAKKQTLVFLFMQVLPFLHLTLIFFIAIFSSTITMNIDSLNLEGLTLAVECLTLNLNDNPDTTPILKHCLIKCVLEDKEIKFAYFSEQMAKGWKPVKRVTILKVEADPYLFQFHQKMDVAKSLMMVHGCMTIFTSLLIELPLVLFHVLCLWTMMIFGCKSRDYPLSLSNKGLVKVLVNSSTNWNCVTTVTFFIAPICS